MMSTLSLLSFQNIDIRFVIGAFKGGFRVDFQDISGVSVSFPWQILIRLYGK